MTPEAAYGLIQNQPENRNHLLQSHFLFNVRRLPTVSYFCQSANLPGWNITAIDQPTVFNPIKRPGGAVQHEELTLRFAVDEKLENWKEMVKWIKECSDYENFNEYKPPNEHFEDSASLFILDSNNQPRFQANFDNLFPVRLSGIIFNTTNVTSDIQYADVSFSFTTYHLVDL